MTDPSPVVSFAERLAARVAHIGAPVCVGLDPHRSRVGEAATSADPAARAAAVEAFCLDALSAIAPTTVLVKPQSAFFEALGPAGAGVLARIIARARSLGLLVLLDAKRGDIGSTAEAYAEAIFDHSPGDADAVTLSPYLGPESLRPFVARAAEGRGAFVLVRTSNPGAEAWQRATGMADAVVGWLARQPASIGAVVGATLPVAECASLRDALPDRWILAPGFGAQGASFEVVRHLGPHVLPTASRSVLFGDAPEPANVRQHAIADRAKRFRDAVVRALQ